VASPDKTGRGHIRIKERLDHPDQVVVVNELLPVRVAFVGIYDGKSFKPVQLLVNFQHVLLVILKIQSLFDFMQIALKDVS